MKPGGHEGQVPSGGSYRPWPQLTVFTKPWKEMALPELGRFVKGLGFDGVELPVRPGFQVTPEDVAAGLPEAAKVLAGHGLEIASVAGPTDEATIAACAEAGVPVIRVCVRMNDDDGYMAAEAKLRREYDALVPLLDKHGVTLGIQNHCDLFVANAMGIRHLIEGYDPRHIAAVWDPAHCALDGERPEIAVDVLWSHLRMVNLKNAVRRRKTGPEPGEGNKDVQDMQDRPGPSCPSCASLLNAGDDVAEWRVHWTAGRQGLCHWPTVAGVLTRRGYAGPVCLTAEYSDHDSVDRLIAEDVAFAKSLFTQGEGEQGEGEEGEADGRGE